MKGEITTEYTFWCGKCTEWYQEAHCTTKASAIKEVKKLGWRCTDKHGWLCPKCLKED
jgi:hypothetical protein